MSTPFNKEQIAALGREKESARWELPAKIRLTSDLMEMSMDELRKSHPEVARIREQTEQKQKEWAEAVNQPGSMPSVQDVWRARSVQIAEELRVLIGQMQGRVGKALTSGEDLDIDAFREAIFSLRRRRAEALALIGRYDLAVQVTPDHERKEGYLNILDALVRSDDEPVCDCPPHRGRTGEYAKLELTQTYVRAEIFSIVHGRVVFLLACSKCGALNAVPELPKALAKARAHRARAQQIAGHLSPADAHRVLSNQKHTAKDLLES